MRDKTAQIAISCLCNSVASCKAGMAYDGSIASLQSQAVILADLHLMLDMSCLGH